MEYLDLTNHDPESYEGKLIIVNGCEYEVGEHLGTGAERIVHRLINRKSKLCLHVLKIQRYPRPAGWQSSEVRAKLAAIRSEEFDFAKIIPISIEIQLPGGTGELQVAALPYENLESPTAVLMEEGDKIREHPTLEETYRIKLYDRDSTVHIKRYFCQNGMLPKIRHSGEFQQAISIYNRVLEINPYHTAALMNLAAAQKETQDLMGAWESTNKAIEIEPNYLPCNCSVQQSSFVENSREGERK